MASIPTSENNDVSATGSQPVVTTLSAGGSQPVTALYTQASIKLNGSNYPVWRVQLNALLVGYDLIGFVDGTNTCPSPTHPDYLYWRRQDQLILHAIISSVDQNVVTMLGNVKNAKQAWDVLSKMFASKTRARIMYLKEHLSRFTKGTKSMSEYLHGIKSLSDELAVINSPLDDVYLVIHTLNGLGLEYREVSAALRTRENPIGFEELHDLLTDFESYLQRDDSTTNSASIATAHAAHKGKQSSHKRGNATGHSSNSSSG